MISTGDYSVNDLKRLIKTFKEGMIISTTLNHDNGTFMTLVYKILRYERYGYVVQLLHEYGNYNYDGKFSSTKYDKMMLTRFIHRHYINHFSIV